MFDCLCFTFPLVGGHLRVICRALAFMNNETMNIYEYGRLCWALFLRNTHWIGTPKSVFHVWGSWQGREKCESFFSLSQSGENGVFLVPAGQVAFGSYFLYWTCFKHFQRYLLPVCLTCSLWCLSVSNTLPSFPSEAHLLPSLIQVG